MLPRGQRARSRVHRRGRCVISAPTLHRGGTGMPRALLIAVLALLALAPSGLAATPGADARFATFNASLNRSAAGQLIADLSTPNNQQAKNAAETIQRIRPDV